MDGTLEAVKNMRRAAHVDFKTFIVYVAAYFTSHPIVSLCGSFFVHCLPLSLTGFPSRLRLLDILASRPGLCRRRLGALRDVPARLGFEPVAADLDRLGAQLLEQVFGVLCIPDQLPILYVRIFFANQPFDCCPRAACTFTGYPLQMTWVPHILRAEGFEISAIPHFDVIVFTLPTTARLL